MSFKCRTYFFAVHCYRLSVPTLEWLAYVMPEQYEYTWERDTPLTVAVVEAVSPVRGKRPVALDPLDSAVDADALENLFHNRGHEDINENIDHVRFEYEACKITVYAAGRIVIEPPD